MSKADIAVRISRNTASSGYTWVNQDFYMDEVLDVPIPDGQKYVIQRSQSQAPTLTLIGDNYKTFSITFILARRGTLEKLKTLRDWTADGGRLLVYPKFQADPDIYYDCLLQPGSIPDQMIFKGWDHAKDTINVTFVEFQKNAAIVEEEA